MFPLSILVKPRKLSNFETKQRKCPVEYLFGNIAATNYSGWILIYSLLLQFLNSMYTCDVFLVVQIWVTLRNFKFLKVFNLLGYHHKENVQNKHKHRGSTVHLSRDWRTVTKIICSIWRSQTRSFLCSLISGLFPFFHTAVSIDIKSAT